MTSLRPHSLRTRLLLQILLTARSRSRIVAPSRRSPSRSPRNRAGRPAGRFYPRGCYVAADRPRGPPRSERRRPAKSQAIAHDPRRRPSRADTPTPRIRAPRRCPGETKRFAVPSNPEGLLGTWDRRTSPAPTVPTARFIRPPACSATTRGRFAVWAEHLKGPAARGPAFRQPQGQPLGRQTSYYTQPVNGHGFDGMLEPLRGQAAR